MPGLRAEASSRQMNADRMILIFKMRCPWPLLPLRMVSFVISGCATSSSQRQTSPRQSWPRCPQDYFHVLVPPLCLSKPICKMGKQLASSPGGILIPESLGPRRQAWDLAALTAGPSYLQKGRQGVLHIVSQ